MWHGSENHLVDEGVRVRVRGGRRLVVTRLDRAAFGMKDAFGRQRTPERACNADIGHDHQTEWKNEEKEGYVQLIDEIEERMRIPLATEINRRLRRWHEKEIVGVSY